jgi:hypothetical protein
VVPTAPRAVSPMRRRRSGSPALGGATRVLRDNIDDLLARAGDRFDLMVVATDHGANGAAIAGLNGRQSRWVSCGAAMRATGMPR